MIKSAGLIANRILRHLGLEIRRVSSAYDFVHRLLYFSRLFNLLRDVDGDVVECGVGQGASLLLLGYLVKEETKRRQLWGFDSFAGFPEPTKEDKSSIRHVRKGDHGNTSILGVRKMLLARGLDRQFVDGQVTLVKGFFEESLAKHRGSSIALLHLDVDLYQSYMTCLQQLYPKVATGGVILFDEYVTTIEHEKFPGAQKAIDEYLGEKKSLIQRDSVMGQYYFIKGR